jgi:hypothetical protein
MVGKNVFVQEGLTYAQQIKALRNGQEVRETIHHRRAFEPREGVEIAPCLYLDTVTVGGTDYKYLFLKLKKALVGKPMLLTVKAGGFSENEVAYFAQLAARYAK